MMLLGVLKMHLNHNPPIYDASQLRKLNLYVAIFSSWRVVLFSGKLIRRVILIEAHVKLRLKQLTNALRMRRCLESFFNYLI
jgi:hypothetical protein